MSGLRRGAGMACLGLGLGFFGLIPSADAQQAPAAGVATPPPLNAQQPGTAPAKSAQKSGGSKAAGEASQGGGDSGLRQRVEQLEAQLIDLQVVIGTLESLARSGGPRPQLPSAAVAGGADPGRLDSIETQIRALTSQVEALAQEVRSGAGAGVGRRSDAGEPSGFTTGTATVSPEPGAPAGAYAPAAGAPGVAPQGATQPPVGQPGRFGSTTVTSDQLDPINDLANGGQAPGAPRPQAGAPAQTAALDPQASGGQEPKQVYEQAYGYLLQQDYGAAQAGFSDFLKRYPSDALAPNALYWLGESQFVQRNFADAAEAFDLVTTAYGGSGKAPDAYLKRGMALAQLGKKPEACSVFRDLAAKYPKAAPAVKSKADAERQRSGCP